MAGRDPSRFDYLFEPIDGDFESVGQNAGSVTPTRPARRPVVLSAAVVLGAGLGAGLVWSGPADAVDTPHRVTTTTAPSTRPATPVSNSAAVESPAPEPSTGPPPTELPAASPPPAPASTQQPPPAPTQQPAPAPAPPPTGAPTPIVRAPISVSPAPRPAFPNQPPGNGSDDRGLLPKLGGLL